MVLSLRSGIHHEVNWALDRLCRLCDNEKFHLQDLPGLIEALFEWPEWYIREGIKGRHSLSALFSKPAEDEKNTRHALLSIMVLHNASVFLPNAMSLFKYSRTRPFILDAMQQLDPNDDTQAEFLIILIQLFGTIIAAQPSSAIVPSPNTNPIPALENVVKVTSNRSLLVASLTTLALLFTESQNAAFFKATSPTLAAALRCIPMFTFADKDVTDAALNYLYVHLSNASMAKAFLLHPDMPSTLRLLVQLILSEQKEEIMAVPILSTPVFPSGYMHTRFRGLSKQEADVIGVMPEPERTYEWYVLHHISFSPIRASADT
jgi:chromatin structure-remodeling complex subunit RSC9